MHQVLTDLAMAIQPLALCAAGLACWTHSKLQHGMVKVCSCQCEAGAHDSLDYDSAASGCETELGGTEDIPSSD